MCDADAVGRPHPRPRRRRRNLGVRSADASGCRLLKIGVVRNPIDAFVRNVLKREGLKPSPQANRAILLRRVTLDLTGLPPTPLELDAFLADTSQSAYEKVVDRLLQSPRYGERMAFRWLEAARYADSSGYFRDGARVMWRWRDWVIDAFNRNMPYDQFTIEQLAGDLLPNPTLDQRIATGFNRNHRGNSEAGVIDASIWWKRSSIAWTPRKRVPRLTMGCARCHNHKYDRYRQGLYSLFAYFNTWTRVGMPVGGNRAAHHCANDEQQAR